MSDEDLTGVLGWAQGPYLGGNGQLPAPLARPATPEPAAEEPRTDEPVGDEPAAYESMTEEPVTTEEPAAEEPVTGELVIEDPVIDGPELADPVIADPVIADPVTEPPAEADDEEDEPAEPGPPLRKAIESILLVADEPVPEVLLAQVLERPRGDVAAALRELAAEYTEQDRGFDLREIAGGWRYYTREDCAQLVERFVRDGQEVRLTQAALETLAVIAYRQPVSRARVSAVRGVNCDGVIRTLVLRGLVEDSGTEPESGAILYRTTGYFLERMGMASLDELPDLAPFLPDNYEDIEDNERTGA